LNFVLLVYKLFLLLFLLKEAGGGNYFDELLARIRDIRSSEKVFWHGWIVSDEVQVRFRNKSFIT
jgi:hypothetical protein